MTQGHGSGWQQGDDFVAAKVSIDIPTEGIQTLRDLSQGINNYRAAAEGAAKSTQSFVGYTQQLVQAANLATEAYRNLGEQMERSAGLQQRASGGAPGMPNAQAALPMSRAAPQGYVDPWAGMGTGMGGQRTSSNSADQIQSQIIDPTRQLDPRKYLNAQAGRYRIQSGDLNPAEMRPVDLDAAASRVDARDRQQRTQEDRTPGRGDMSGGMGWGGLANNIMNEMAPGGGSHMGMANLAVRAMGNIGTRMNAAARGGAAGSEVAQAANAGDAASAEAAASSGGLGSMLGGMGSAFGMLGRAAGPIGAGLAGVGMLEKGGAMYQGYKNMGLIRGGGAGEGFDSEMQVRSMALNPFLSTEQSRQIVMAGLTEGYSGKQYDTVTQFMAQNLKEMNLQVSDSVQLLRKNVNEGGQSVGGLAASLGMLKELSKTGAMSLPDMQQMFKQGTGNMISAGVGGGAAAQAMTEAMGGWGNDQSLKGLWPQMVSNAGSTASSGALLEAYSGVRVPGLDPSMFSAYASANGMDMNDVSGQALSSLAKKIFGNMTPDPKNKAFLNRIRMWKQMLQSSFGIQVDTTQAIQMAQQALGGNNPAAEGKQKQQAVASQVSDPESALGMLGDTAGMMGDVAMQVGGSAADLVTGNWGNFGHRSDVASKAYDTSEFRAMSDASNPMLDSIINQYGPSGVEAIDSSGNATPVTGSRAQVEAMAKGDLKWRRKGDTGGGISLAQTPTQLDENFRTGGGPQQTSQTNVNFNPAQVQISFGAGGMTATPNPVQLTPNQQAVNSGVGDNTMNNPPPGDGYGYWPGKSLGLH